MKRLIGALLCLCLCGEAALKTDGSITTLDEIGIKFTGFHQMKAVMTSPPKAQGMWKNPTTKKVTYGYSPKSLWRSEQIEAIWKTADVTLTVGAFHSPYPLELLLTGKETKLIPTKAYNFWKKTSGKRFKKDKKSRDRWVELFCQTQLSKKSRKLKGSKLLITEYIPVKNGKKHKIFVVRNVQVRGEYVIFDFKFDNEIESADFLAIKSFLKSMRLFRAKKEKVEKVTATKHKKRGSKTSKYEASIERALTSVKNQQGWWYLESNNFIVVSNMKNRKQGRNLQEHLENSRKVYEFLFPISKRFDDISIVRLFNRRSGYLDYVGKELEWSIGVWIAAQEELVVSPLYDKVSPVHAQKELEATVVHEGFHQYLYYALNHRNVAPWFNEGTAKFFENVKFPNSKSFRIPVGAQSLEFNDLRKFVVSKKVDIASLIQMEQAQFINPKTIQQNYVLSWGLMFYLYKGTLVTNQRRYAKIPYIYYRSLLEGKDQMQATKAAWKGINIREFTKAFSTFWKNSGLIKKASKQSLLDAHRKSRKHYGIIAR